MPYKYPRTTKHDFVVRRSSAGLGLFAESEIAKDDFVTEYHGPLLSQDEADEKGGKYLFAIDKKLTIDGSSRKNTARYLNHSCKPNCEPEIDGKRIYIYAKKKIQPGEELTYNYGKEYFNDYIKPYGCRCSSH
ncbi:MAG: SET domain-containing protein [Candidatus Andersenbacteria bacterium]